MAKTWSVLPNNCKQNYHFQINNLFLNEIKLNIVKISISDLTFQNLMLRDIATSMAHSPRSNTLKLVFSNWIPKYKAANKYQGRRMIGMTKKFIFTTHLFWGTHEKGHHSFETRLGFLALSWEGQHNSSWDLKTEDHCTSPAASTAPPEGAVGSWWGIAVRSNCPYL